MPTTRDHDGYCLWDSRFTDYTSTRQAPWRDFVGLPENLQGTWNNSSTPTWNSDYHLNINVQMNHLPAGLMAMSECHEPLLEWMRVFAQRGAKTARVHYGCDGICHVFVGAPGSFCRDSQFQSSFWRPNSFRPPRSISAFTTCSRLSTCDDEYPAWTSFTLYDSTSSISRSVSDIVATAR